ncbi:MAG: 50S ribosomal protein L4 [Firmicutes bacterium]|nr:50S ribosomal protein L4 [Bacillota bacterium]
MPKIKVFNQKAEETGTLTLSEGVFGAEFNEPLVHQIVVAHLANQRQGTKAALSRSDVRGKAKKPWKQKHTGRARQGSRKGPQWIGGGMAFALTPRDFSQKVNKKMKAEAFKSALSVKVTDKQVVVLDGLKLKDHKTSGMQKVLDAFKIKKNVLLVTAGANENILKAGANIPYLNIVNAELLNTYEVMCASKVMFTTDAIKAIEEAYAK